MNRARGCRSCQSAVEVTDALDLRGGAEQSGIGRHARGVVPAPPDRDLPVGVAPEDVAQPVTVEIADTLYLPAIVRDDAGYQAAVESTRDQMAKLTVGWPRVPRSARARREASPLKSPTAWNLHAGSTAVAGCGVLPLEPQPDRPVVVLPQDGRTAIGGRVVMQHQGGLREGELRPALVTRYETPSRPENDAPRSSQMSEISPLPFASTTTSG